MLNILSSVSTPSYSNVYYKGRDMVNFSKKDIAFYRRNEIGLIFQHYMLVPNLTVTENIELGYSLKQDNVNLNELSNVLGIQDMSRAMMTTRIAIMKSFDIKSLPYRAMKNHWRILHKDSRELSDKAFYSRTFRQTLTPREIVDKTLAFSDELRYYDDLYQLLLFHFQEKRTAEFFELIEDHLNLVNHHFLTVLKYENFVFKTL